jgi:riboflavin synthase
MFTGLVSDIGTVLQAEDAGASLRKLTIESHYAPDTIALGASICCAGICLTVTDLRASGKGAAFDVNVAAETLARTLAGQWQAGAKLNLERSLKLGDELGGHIVSGHVDGIATVLERHEIAPDSTQEWAATARFVLQAPRDLARFIAVKGSVALDGTSLTVNEVEDDRFGVLLIPHTLSVTTWGSLKAGDRVHLEVDMMARYAARLAEAAAKGY